MNESKPRARYTLEFKFGGGQTGQGWPGAGRHGQDTGHREADAGELGALGPQRPAKRCR